MIKHCLRKEEEYISWGNGEYKGQLEEVERAEYDQIHCIKYSKIYQINLKTPDDLLPYRAHCFKLSKNYQMSLKTPDDMLLYP